jgi:hypothetical protein
VTSRLVSGDRKLARARVSDIWKQVSAVDLSAVTDKFVPNMPSIPPDKAVLSLSFPFEERKWKL